MWSLRLSRHAESKTVAREFWSVKKWAAKDFHKCATKTRLGNGLRSGRLVSRHAGTSPEDPLPGGNWRGNAACPARLAALV